MATYLLFGKMNPASARAVSAQRSDDAIALIRKCGGEYKAGYALLGEVDYVVNLDLPDTQRALQVSLGLCKLVGMRFSTSPGPDGRVRPAGVGSTAALAARRIRTTRCRRVVCAPRRPCRQTGGMAAFCGRGLRGAGFS